MNSSLPYSADLPDDPEMHRTIADAPSALVIEDTPPLGSPYERYLRRMGYQVQWVATGSHGLEVLESDRPDLVLLDLQLPDIHGYDILQKMKTAGHSCPCVVITAHGSADSALKSMRLGAADFLEKPFTAERLRVTVDNVMDKRRLHDEVQIIRQQIERDGYAGFVGRSLPMQVVYRIIDSAATSRASVFITGESGTGKELCAQAIHERSDRSNKPFVAINCGAIPRELFESEIFGHMKGAFSGAHSDRQGAAERANGGTLFLDEIGEMDLDLQVKLLRFIQTGVFQRVGGTKDIRVNVRFVCATNQDPQMQVADKQFREDLYYRLNVIPIRMPALRDRERDILDIAEAFLARLSREEGRTFTGFDANVQSTLLNYDWPGNVPQLHNVVHNIVLLNDGEVVTRDMLPDPLGLTGTQAEGGATPRPRPRAVTSSANPGLAIEPLWLVEKRAIEAAIEQCDDNVPVAAAHLGVSASTVYRKLKAWEASS